MTLQWVQESNFLGDACTEDEANRAKCKGLVIAALAASGQLPLLASGIPQAMVDACVQKLCEGSATAPPRAELPPFQERIPQGNEPGTPAPRANPSKRADLPVPPVDQTTEEPEKKDYTLWWIAGGALVAGGLAWLISRNAGHLLGPAAEA